MSDYTQVNDYSAKDALATGDANKVIKGSDIDAELSAIITAITSKANSASPTLTGTVTATGATVNVATAGDLVDSALVANTAFVRNMLPAGVLVPYAGTVSPDTSIWLLCDGQAVSRTTYAVLFALVSTTFGVGDGSTTFDIPDLRGRVAIGMDNYAGGAANRVTDTEADSLGGTLGTETHQLVTSEMPAHTHGNSPKEQATTHVGSGSSSFKIDLGQSISAGGDGAHKNMPPYMALGYLIKV